MVAVDWPGVVCGAEPSSRPSSAWPVPGSAWPPDPPATTGVGASATGAWGRRGRLCRSQGGLRGRPRLRRRGSRCAVGGGRHVSVRLRAGRSGRSGGGGHGGRGGLRRHGDGGGNRRLRNRRGGRDRGSGLCDRSRDGSRGGRRSTRRSDLADGQSVVRGCGGGWGDGTLGDGAGGGGAFRRPITGRSRCHRRQRDRHRRRNRNDRGVRGRIGRSVGVLGCLRSLGAVRVRGAGLGWRRRSSSPARRRAGCRWCWLRSGRWGACRADLPPVRSGSRWSGTTCPAGCRSPLGLGAQPPVVQAARPGRRPLRGASGAGVGEDRGDVVPASRGSPGPRRRPGPRRGRRCRRPARAPDCRRRCRAAGADMRRRPPGTAGGRAGR